MNGKASLVLMEQLLMVLVFSVAAALCLLVFARSDEVAAQTAHLDEAVIIARNAAELLKAGEDPACLETGSYTLQVTPQPGTAPGMAQAEITVRWAGDVLFTLTTGWQEVAQ